MRHWRLDYALYSNQLDIVKALLDAGANVDIKINNRKETILIDAIKNNRLDVVEKLIDADANVNLPDRRGASPLLWAVHMEIYFDSLPIIEKLIGANADVNKADDDGNCPLDSAVTLGRLDLVKALLDAGANVDEAFQKAIKCGDSKIVQALMDAGVDLTGIHENQADASRNANVLRTIKKELTVIKGIQDNLDEDQGHIPSGPRQ